MYKLDKWKNIIEGNKRIENFDQGMVELAVTTEMGHFCAVQWKMWTEENGNFYF